VSCLMVRRLARVCAPSRSPRHGRRPAIRTAAPPHACAPRAGARAEPRRRAREAAGAGKRRLSAEQEWTAKKERVLHPADELTNAPPAAADGRRTRASRQATRCRSDHRMSAGPRLPRTGR
jgi:hypothetical protein